jgi:hypothetical protein
METAQSPEGETEEGVGLARKDKRKIGDYLAPDTILVVVVCIICILYLIFS